MFTNQSARLLEIGGKVKLTRNTLKIKRRKYVTEYGSLSFARNLSEKYEKKYWILLQKQE